MLVCVCGDTDKWRRSSLASAFITDLYITYYGSAQRYNRLFLLQTSRKNEFKNLTAKNVPQFYLISQIVNSQYPGCDIIKIVQMLMWIKR